MVSPLEGFHNRAEQSRMLLGVVIFLLQDYKCHSGWEQAPFQAWDPDWHPPTNITEAPQSLLVHRKGSCQGCETCDKWFLPLHPKALHCKQSPKLGSQCQYVTSHVSGVCPCGQHPCHYTDSTPAVCAQRCTPPSKCTQGSTCLPGSQRSDSPFCLFFPSKWLLNTFKVLIFPSYLPFSCWK